MKLETTRFGMIEVKESELITMHGSILGFENLRQFVLLEGEKNMPFWWLQSVQEPTVAFVVIHPQIIKHDYNPSISEDDLDFLDIKNNEDMALLTIITIRSNPTRVTANLRAPILINALTRLANQIILSDTDMPLQYDILENKANLSHETQRASQLGTISAPAPA